MYNLVFIDTETTGLTTDPTARLCQVAYKFNDKMTNELFKPLVPIDLMAMSVHGITEESVASKPPFIVSPQFKEVKDMFSKKENVFVAHNSEFDLEMIKREGIDVVSQICTKTLAQRLMKKSEFGVPNYKLQTLRYFFNITLDEAKAHDAEGDVLVLEQVFIKLKEIARMKADEATEKQGKDKWTDDELIEYMIKVSNSPINEYTEMPFGKHKGKTLKELIIKDKRYCEWLVNTKPDSTDKLIVALKFLLSN